VDNTFGQYKNMVLAMVAVFQGSDRLHRRSGSYAVSGSLEEARLSLAPPFAPTANVRIGPTGDAGIARPAKQNRTDQRKKNRTVG